MKINIEIEDNIEKPLGRGRKSLLDADTIAKLKSMEIGQSFVVSKVQQGFFYTVVGSKGW